MKITRGLENATFNPKTVTTLGSFDGMHRGHIEILKRLVHKKKELGLNRSVILTFDPHPQEVLHKNNTSVDLLTTIDERHLEEFNQHRINFSITTQIKYGVSTFNA